MNHHLADLGWVDIDLEVPLILPIAHSAKLSSAQAESGRQWIIQNQGQGMTGFVTPRPHIRAVCDGFFVAWLASLFFISLLYVQLTHILLFS